MEPVTLDLFKQHARLTGNSEDALIELYIQASREKSESFTNRDFVSKVKTSTYYANQNCPIAAVDIISVSGFYTSKADLATAQLYFEEYRKGITTNRDYPICWDNISTYMVTYNVTVDPADVPASAKTAILKIASDLYENRETSSDLTNKSLSVNHRTLLAPLVKISNV